MAEMICWQDNSEYTCSDDVKQFFPIADRPLSELMDDNGNSLLVYPHSFHDCRDGIGQLHIVDISLSRGQFVLKTGNLAGYISIDGVPVSIRSRFSNCNEKDFFLQYMLKKVLSLNLFDMKHSTTDECVLDFLLYLFPHYLNDALSQGLYKEYMYKEYNDSNVRGAIDVGRHIKVNMPFCGRVAYRTREFSYDNHVTQLVRHTIEYIRTLGSGEMVLHSDADTQANVSRIVWATPSYCRRDRADVCTENAKPVSHPYFTRYAALQNICMRILNHKRLKYGCGKDNIYGILFDVSWLWEEYLATMLKRLGFRHPDNRRRKGGIYLGRSRCDSGRNAFLRFPDFYDNEVGGVIADAKYKRNIDRGADVNQMVSYMYRLKGRCGLFIQPAERECTYSYYALKGHGDDADATLGVYHFGIPVEASSYEDFEKGMSTAEKAFMDAIACRRNVAGLF